MPVAERQSPYVARFDAFRRAPDAGPDWLRGAREAAFARFLERGFPTTRDEEWRFTNVAPITNTPFAQATSGTLADTVLAPSSFADVAAAEIVVVNGRISRALSSVGNLPSGVAVRSVRDDWQALGDQHPGAEPSGRPGPGVATTTPFT